MEKTSPQVLAVEDDELLAQSLVATIELAGYQVMRCSSVSEARLLLERQPIQLLLLDVILPDGDGILFCAELRSKGYTLPIVILTAQVDELAAVRGLDAGANDYVRKPFSNRELVARIRVALRGSPKISQRVSFGELILDADERCAIYRGQPLQLSRRQFDILFYLVGHAETVVTRERLMNYLGNDQDVFCRTIDTHISSIRKILRTVGALNLRLGMIYGTGYRLESV